MLLYFCAVRLISTNQKLFIPMEVPHRVVQTIVTTHIALGHTTTIREVYTEILGSESFARWLVSLALALVLVLVLVLVLELALALELELALALEIELALALDIERYRITASVNHLTCPLPPHQSVI